MSEKISKLDELKKFLDDAKGDKEVELYLDSLKSSPKMSEEEITKFLETKEGKKYHQPLLDAYHSKGLETWKEKNLQRLIDEACSKAVDEAIKKANPQETAEQKRIRELEASFELEKKGRAKEVLKNKALQKLTERSIPPEFLEILEKGEDEEAVVKSIDKLDALIKGHLTKLETDFQVKHGRNPEKSIQTSLTKDSLKAMTAEQILSLPKEEVDYALSH
jgi:hypothetical protein